MEENVERAMQMLETLRVSLLCVEHGAITVERDSEAVTAMASGMQQAFLRLADVVLKYSHMNTARIVGLSEDSYLPSGKDSVGESREVLYERLERDGDCLTDMEEHALQHKFQAMKGAYENGLKLIPGTEDIELSLERVL